jgi:hypothetical protein
LGLGGEEADEELAAADMVVKWSSRGEGEGIQGLTSPLLQKGKRKKEENRACGNLAVVLYDRKCGTGISNVA